MDSTEHSKHPNLKRNLIDFGVIFGIFVFTIISYLFINFRYKTHADGDVAHCYSYLLLFILIVVGCFLKYFKKLTLNRLILLIFLVGVVTKLNYVLITPYNYRQHDVVTSTNVGHQGYAFIIYNDWTLPTTTTSDGFLAYQFYHPPLNAFLQAVWMLFSKILFTIANTFGRRTVYDIENLNVLYESTQLLSCLYMVVTSYFSIKLLKKMKLSDFALVVGVLFITLFTNFVIEAAQENNDPLCIMFSFIGLYYTYEWYESKSTKSALLIGLFIGLAAATKFSGFVAGIPAFVVYVIFVVKAIKSKNKGETKNLVLQPILLALIAAPLGLWFQIYAKIKFNQPLGYVFSNLTPKLYKGDYSFFQRFIAFWDLKDMTASLYPSTFIHYNLFNFTIKSSIFGEYSISRVNGLYLFAIAFNYFFVLCSIVLFVIYMFASKHEAIKEKIFALLIIISNVLCMLYFNITMPYGCTMDFRYMVPILIGFVMMLALSIDKLRCSNSKFNRVYSFVVMILGAGMLICSNLVFLIGV